MNGLLKLVDKKPKQNKENIPIKENSELNLETLSQKEYWNIEEVLPIIFSQDKINPFNNPILKDKKVSCEKIDNQEIEKIAGRLQQLILQRKCKVYGVCEIRNELYMETFNELIRQISIDCPQRGILLANVRNEIQYSLKTFEDLYSNSINFATRRQAKADENYQDLIDEKKELMTELMQYDNQKICYQNELKNLEDKIQEIEKNEQLQRENELNFLQQQNENLEHFFETISAYSDPFQIKNVFSSNFQ